MIAELYRCVFGRLGKGRVDCRFANCKCPIIIKWAYVDIFQKKIVIFAGEAAAEEYLLTDVEGPWCLLAFKLQQEEAAGLVVVAEPQGHS